MGKIVIRLDFVVLVLEVLKLQGLIDISWSTILLLLFIPWAFGKFIIWYFRRMIRLNRFPSWIKVTKTK